MDYVILNFIFNQEELNIQYKKNEYMKEIFSKFAIKIGKDINNFNFLQMEYNK